jgi:phage tail sheath protein FI
MVSSRGLYEFRVVCDETTNTPDKIDAGVMAAVVFLRPTKAAEFIQVDLVLTNTGVSFEEVLSS